MNNIINHPDTQQAPDTTQSGLFKHVYIQEYLD